MKIRVSQKFISSIIKDHFNELSDIEKIEFKSAMYRSYFSCLIFMPYDIVKSVVFKCLDANSCIYLEKLCEKIRKRELKIAKSAKKEQMFTVSFVNTPSNHKIKNIKGIKDVFYTHSHFFPDGFNSGLKYLKDFVEGLNKLGPYNSAQLREFERVFSRTDAIYTVTEVK